MAELQTQLTNINFMSKERFESLESIDDGQLYAVEFPFTDEDLVHTRFDEEIYGVKTFNDEIYAPNQIDYNNITNCITEIPQDIKLELVDGTLTLKAGSKVYVPNGAGVFDVYTSISDLTNRHTANGTFIAFLSNNRTIDIVQTKYTYSGTSQPTGINQYSVWYDITNNIVKKTNNSGSTWISSYSLPICIFTVSNGAISSIDQVFNGFGYIGSIVFALPGVKGLIPNGRNEDGSLRNTEFIIKNVSTLETLGTYTDYLLEISNTDKLYDITEYRLYDEQLNYNTSSQGGALGLTPVGKISTSNDVITSLTPKLPFRAVDYNDFVEEITNIEKTKQDEATAVNYDNITNCITEIPQDIKLELVDGTLTLKASSKVYVPNGFESDGTTKKFDELVVENDAVTQGAGGTISNYLLSYGTNRAWSSYAGIDYFSSGNMYSGDTQPTTTTTNNNLWYDTANNKIMTTSDGGSTWIESRVGLPFCIVSSTNGTISSIDQVFNGMGYIGSIVFALPGVKGLIPNGRNEDGSLRNTEFTTSKVITEIAPIGTQYIRLEAGVIQTGDLIYNETENINTFNGEYRGFAVVGTITADSNRKITSFQLKLPFRAADYNDLVALDSATAKLDGDNTFTGTNTFTNTIQGTAYRALWGDLAEYYESDYNYPKGTLVQFGGEKEITVADNDVNAVITSDPGFILNTKQDYDTINSQAIALVGKVPVRVIGKVNKFDYLHLSSIPGVAESVKNSEDEYPSSNVIARALEQKDSEEEGLVLCVVKFEL